jgi:DeoR family transcriptional regulator, fructose operon transcriptional repressor
VLPSERRRRLLARLNEDGPLAVPELSAKLRVSPATVRRDLQLLASAGRLQRVRGGAVPATAPGDTAEPLHQEKVRRHLREKQAIAAEAARRVRDGFVVALDSGTTTLVLAKELRKYDNLTVITTDLKIALVLADAPSIDVIIVGGSVRKNLYSVVGPLAERAVAELNAQVCFLGADAIEVASGVTNASLSEVAVKRALLRCGRERILLADHSKFDRVSLAEVAALEGFTEVITDDGISSDVASRYRAEGANLTLARMEG